MPHALNKASTECQALCATFGSCQPRSRPSVEARTTNTRAKRNCASVLQSCGDNLSRPQCMTADAGSDVDVGVLGSMDSERMIPRNWDINGSAGWMVDASERFSGYRPRAQCASVVRVRVSYVETSLVFKEQHFRMNIDTACTVTTQYILTSSYMLT